MDRQDIDILLDEWVEAKRAKDFAKADKIRAQLWDQDIDAETERPRENQGGGQRGNPGAHDAEVSASLDEWVQAKRSKDFATADAIREELYALGVDPEIERPPGHESGLAEIASRRSGGGKKGAKGGRRDIERQLDQWVEAKRSKDFATADALREELHALGVNPEQERPKGGRNDQWIEDMLDKWVSAKRMKDFESADRIRDQLSAQGVDAEEMRPADGRQPKQKSGPSNDAWAPSGGHRFGSKGGRQDIERDLDQWVEAKRNKDFATADGLREKLYALGVDAESARPKDGWAQPKNVQPNRRQPNRSQIERQLDQWVEAKRSKDFATADALREDLYALGVDPDQERPKGGRNDQWIEDMLDKWVSAKRMKDFESADRIRDQLSAQGVDAEEMRPADGRQPKQTSGPSKNVWAPNGGNRPSPKGGRRDVECELDQWVEAKRNKDFATADAIREKLYALGVDPESARPKDGWALPKDFQPNRRQPNRSQIERQLDQWVEAKRSKDFATADSLREELHALGVNPEEERPKGGRNDQWIEDMLDKWVSAKRMKDFESADRMRDQLAAQGVDAEEMRPAVGGQPQQKRRRQ